MNKSILSLGYMSLFILITAMQCDDDDITAPCEDTSRQLLEFKSTIQNLANQSVCGDDFECRYIAFGSKPCGGPWEFLVYSTSIDTLTITSLVMEYNQLETNYNQNCNTVSDCSTLQPPIGFECDNNQCIPLF